MRLRYGYCITCDEVVERDGEVVELRAAPRYAVGGTTPSGGEVSGVIHWVRRPQPCPPRSASTTGCSRCPGPRRAAATSSGRSNPDSLAGRHGRLVEPSLASAEPGSRWQLERVGYFVVDQDTAAGGARAEPHRHAARLLAGHVDAGGTGRGAQPHEKSAKAKTRPPKKSRTEYRAEARLRDPVLAERLASWPALYGIAEDDAELLSGDRATGDLFLEAIDHGAATPPAVARWIVNELPPALGDRQLADTRLTGTGLSAVVAAVEGGEISAAVAKDVFAEVMDSGADPRQIIADRGLAQVSDEGAIAALVDDVMAGNADKVEQYRGGKTALFGFFVGQTIKRSGGKANPEVVQRVLTERLA